MALLDPIDIYCERIGTNIFAEPLNALSNISFLLAALALAMLAFRKNRRQPHAWLLIGLIALVGIGSSLFHLFANELTLLADVIPIGMLVMTYLWLAQRRIVGLSLPASAAGIGIFLLLSIATSYAPARYQLNGSLGYLPCLLAIATLAVMLVSRNLAAARLHVYAACLFTLSLSFRSIDMALCESFPTGTHLFWHLLNGVVLYFLGRALILHGKNPAK